MSVPLKKKKRWNDSNKTGNSKAEGSIDFESYGASCINCNHRFKKTDF